MRSRWATAGLLLRLALAGVVMAALVRGSVAGWLSPRPLDAALEQQFVEETALELMEERRGFQVTAAETTTIRDLVIEWGLSYNFERVCVLDSAGEEGDCHEAALVREMDVSPELEAGSVVVVWLHARNPQEQGERSGR